MAMFWWCFGTLLNWVLIFEHHCGFWVHSIALTRKGVTYMIVCLHYAKKDHQWISHNNYIIRSGWG